MCGEIEPPHLIDFENENVEAKKLAIEKPSYWEFLLAAELLENRLVEIRQSYYELEKGLVFKQTKRFEAVEYLNWTADRLHDFRKIIKILKKSFEIELHKSFGEPGIAGNVFEIKQAVDKVFSMCKELLAWEYEILGAIPPDELKEIPKVMKGWTKCVIDEIDKFPNLLKSSFSAEKEILGGTIDITIKIIAPSNMGRVAEILDEVSNKMKLQGLL